LTQSSLEPSKDSQDLQSLEKPLRSTPRFKDEGCGVIFQPSKIITHLRKQKYNADYDCQAKQESRHVAFISLLEEKLLPALIHTFWVDAKNYVEHTRSGSRDHPLPTNFFIPNQMHKKKLESLQLIQGGAGGRTMTRWKKLYTESHECLSLLSQRLGKQKFFFGDSPASIDAYIFSYLAPILNVKLPSNKLQQHLKTLPNLCQFCTSIFSIYFAWDGDGVPRVTPKSPTAETPDSEEDPHKRRNQILSVLVGLLAMVGYAVLSGIVSIQSAPPDHALKQGVPMDDNEEEEE
ncbi:hypothetical protein GDO86_018595, partial [Hymenochirus boettgeri]